MGGPGKKFDRALVVQETRFDFGNKGGKTICKGKMFNENGGKKSGLTIISLAVLVLNRPEKIIKYGWIGGCKR